MFGPPPLIVKRQMTFLIQQLSSACILMIHFNRISTQRYPCQPNVTVAPTLKQKLKTELNSRERVEELSQQLQQSELREGVPAVTAMDSPGGIWDESVRELMTQKKPALNDSTAIQGKLLNVEW